MKLLDQLQEQGYKVKVRHVRKFNPPKIAPVYMTTGEAKRQEAEFVGWPGRTLSSTGGKCQVEIWTLDAEGNPVDMIVSSTVVCSDNDVYSRHLGLTKALGKAIGALNRKAGHTVV